METQMIVGITAGFGFFIGVVCLCCVIWKICCGKPKEKKKKRTKIGQAPEKA